MLHVVTGNAKTMIIWKQHMSYGEIVQKYNMLLSSLATYD